jgi:hypothetical protein
MSVSNVRAVCAKKPHITPTLADFEGLGITTAPTLSNALKQALKWLQKNFPCELVYKNAIAEQMLTNDAVMLHEFPVGLSRIDCVIASAHAHALEIKSEFDSCLRLEKQLQDYSKAFRYVSIVVPQKLERYYAALTKEILPSAGVYVLCANGALERKREPTEYTANLDVETMFASLRGAEYRRIYKHITSEKPNFTDGDMYTQCLKTAKTITPKEFSVLYDAELAGRKLKNNTYLQENKDALSPLMSRLVLINPTIRQISRVQEWLGQAVR